MTLASLSLVRPQTTVPATVLPAVALPAVALKVAARPAVTTAPKTPSPDAAPVPDQARVRREARKDQAKQQVMALIERMKTLKQFASDDPRVMARQLAQIVKALKSALKAYADAGGAARSLGSVPTATPAPVVAPADAALSEGATADSPDGVTAETADAATPQAQPAGDAASVAPAEARNHYEKLRDSIAGSEAAGDMAFVKRVRDFGKSIRDLLTKAKVQTAVKGPDDETRAAFKATDEGLKDIDDALDSLDHDIRASSPAAGLFVGVYA